MTVITGRRVFVVITGASRGIGRQIALSIAADVAGGSAFLLLARNTEALTEVKNKITEVNPEATVVTMTLDLATAGVEQEIGRVVKEITHERTFESRLIFHNAGTIGDMSRQASQLSDPEDWHAYLHTNLIGTVCLNNQLLALLPRTAEQPVYIVNVTSLTAVKAFSSMTQYCVGKAAREAFFRSLALETDNVRVLSYSPGPVETDMVAQIHHDSFDPAIRDMFAPAAFVASEMHRKRLTPRETVAKLIALIDHDDFVNGGRIDFFD